MDVPLDGIVPVTASVWSASKTDALIVGVDGTERALFTVTATTLE